MQTNTIYRIALRIESSNSIALLVNGTLVQTLAFPYPLPSVSAITDLRIGSPSVGGTYMLMGDIDEFAIIPSLLSDAQIAALESAATT